MNIPPEAILLAVYALGRGARIMTTEKPAQSSGAKPRWPRRVPKAANPQVATPMTRTWQPSQGGPDEWRRSRYRALLDWMKSSEGAFDIDTEWPKLEEIAKSVLAHWDLEAASGQAEYNYNAGGIGARPGDKFFASKDAQTGKAMSFAAYDSLPQFIGDYWGVLALPRYAEALRLLLTNPQNDAWIRALGRGGYYGADQNVVAKAWAERRKAIERAVQGIKA